MQSEQTKKREVNTMEKANALPRIMFRLRRPDGRIFGTGSTTGSFWNTPQEALAAKKKSGIKDLMIYEYDRQAGEFRGEVMID
jgi:hypothetical protein